MTNEGPRTTHGPHFPVAFVVHRTPSFNLVVHLEGGRNRSRRPFLVPNVLVLGLLSLPPSFLPSFPPSFLTRELSLSPERGNGSLRINISCEGGEKEMVVKELIKRKTAKEYRKQVILKVHANKASQKRKGNKQSKKKGR